MPNPPHGRIWLFVVSTQIRLGFSASFDARLNYIKKYHAKQKKD
jgi:hypothetical protein